MNELERVLDSRLSHVGTVRVLEAGCGSLTHIKVGKNMYLVGIDVSREQLDRNNSVNEKILGDIETYSLPPSSFDLIVCWDVLEHLRQPLVALGNLVGALKNGGVLVIKIPNVLSVKGLVTKWSPHPFHEFVYRRFMPFLPPDDQPFRTFMRFSMVPRSIARFARTRGLEIAFLGGYEAYLQRQMRERFRVTGTAWKVLSLAIGVITVGGVEAEMTDYVIVLERPES